MSVLLWTWMWEPGGQDSTTPAQPRMSLRSSVQSMTVTITKTVCTAIWRPPHGVETSWNVTAHAQKPDFVFRRNGRVHLNRRVASVQSTTGSRSVRIGGSNAGYTMFRGSVKGIGYPLHSPVSPSLPLPCVTVCHHISIGIYTPTVCSYSNHRPKIRPWEYMPPQIPPSISWRWPI